MSFKIVTDSSSNLYTLPGCDYAYVPLKINCDEGNLSIILILTLRQ